MKTLYKFLIVGLVFCMAGCDNTDLDLLNDPNLATTDNASVEDLYNNIQLAFNNVAAGPRFAAGSMARMYHNNSSNYASSTNEGSLNGIWNTVYSTMFPDIDALILLAEPRGQDIHAGSAKVMKAYALMMLADMIGTAPNSEAGQGTDIQNPKRDSGEELYAAANNLLDEAIAQLSGTSAPSPASDSYYGGDAAKWATAANTMKMRAALTTRLVGGNPASFVGGDIIDDASEDFQFRYGTQRNNPNSRHPQYNNHYEQGDGDYISNYFMWTMVAEKKNADGLVVRDPRTRYYFYRKIKDVTDRPTEEYGCELSERPDQEAKPDHWDAVDPNFSYCYAAPDGYYGRDFLNGSGIPPDGPIRTSYGLYPAGGQFDDETFQNTRQLGTTGALGGGITPIWLASWTDFALAENAAAGGSGDARALLESGIRKSIAKVKSFGGLVPGTLARTFDDRGTIKSVEEVYVPSDEDIDEYVNLVLANFDAADATGKQDIVAKEFYIAQWGNGLEAYNMVRRTGMPLNLQPALLENPGPFVRSFFLPSNHVDRNAGATQKELTERVFWDQGPEIR